MTDEKRQAFNAELSEMDLTAVIARLASLDEEVRAATEVEAVEEMTERKKMLLERKAELEDLEARKADAAALEEGAFGESIEKKGSEMEERFTTASPEYRSAFFKQLLNQPLTEAEERAIVQSGGNGVIPVETAKELVHRMKEVAPLLSEITLSRVAGMVTVGTLLEPDDAYLHAETATITASSDTLAYVTLGGYEFAKIVPVSKSMQAMSVDAFEGWLIDIIYEDVAAKIENAIITGTGTNQPGGLGSITLTASTNLISTTASITYDDVCTLMTYPVKGFRKKAKFMCNSTFLYGSLAKIKDSQQRPIFVESMAAGTPNRLMGKELVISEECPDDTLWYGDFTKIFGNLSSDLEVEVSEHSSFRAGMIDYRGFAVFDCKVAAPRAFGKFKKN